MSETQDEAADLDAGWDDAESDSAPSQSGAPPLSSEPEPSADEVDGGWDDAPSGEAPAEGAVRRRPHRKRRAKSSNALPVSANPVLLPRPAEPTKKHHRDHARQQRAHEAQAKQQRKTERKAERAEQAKREAAERLRQAEADAQARRLRQEARDRARSERPERPAPKPKPSATKATREKSRPAELKRSEPAPTVKRSGPRYGVIITVLLVAAVVALLVFKK